MDITKPDANESREAALEAVEKTDITPGAEYAKAQALKAVALALVYVGDALNKIAQTPCLTKY